MRISLSTEGGIANFPGLNRPISFSVDELPSKLQSELRRLIDAAGFFELPAQCDPPPPGAGDYRTYTLTVQTPEHTHTVKVHDPVGDERLRRLIQFVRAARVGK